jgi:acetyltransferase-like isoleucine patch superfamily enzyme
MNTNNPTISVITVVYNGISAIEKTIQSAVNQTYPFIEYIIIDGGSTDGTADVIKKYQDAVSYWISEPDKGIYDAMNKGIEKASGAFTIFLNCGDYFYSNTVFQDIVNNYSKELAEYDLLYGRSKIIKKDGSLFDLVINHSHTELWRGPNFRHGALLARTAILKEEKFEISKELKIAADFDFIYKCYNRKHSFFSMDIVLLVFLEEGVSDNPYKHLKDSVYILKKYNDWNLKTRRYYLYKYSRVVLSRTPVQKVYKAFQLFFQDYFSNYWINKIPFYFIRHFYYRKVMGIKIGKGSSIHLNCFITGKNIEIAENSVINRKCFLDGRGKLFIGNFASISPEVHLITGDHDYNSPDFEFRSKDIYVGDYAWIGSRATILPGVKIGKGAVVCAGAVVTRDVQEFAVVAGVPAVKIKERSRDLRYNPSWFAYFD